MSTPAFRFYHWLERVRWLRSYRRKFLFVAFVGTHIPLLALIAFLACTRGTATSGTIFWLTLSATLAGTLLVLWALRLLLQPILLAGEALNTFLQNGEIIALPDDLHDEAGGMMRDIGSAIRTFAHNQQVLERSAETDFLTGLRNRRGADDRLRQSLAEQEVTGKPVYVALLDIDHFKKLNDDLGHGLGDRALKNLGAYLQQSLSESGDWAARWGGEEFLLVRQGDESIEAVTASIDRLRKNVPRLETENNGTRFVTASVGITKAALGDSVEEVLARADAALYTAKHNGRDQTRFL